MKNIIQFVGFVVLAFVLNQQIIEGSLFAKGIAVSAGVVFIAWCVKVMRDVR